MAFPGPPRMAGVGALIPVVDSNEWQRKIRSDFVGFYGPQREHLLPVDFVSSPFIQALLLSRRYMGEGVREAAFELFDSPAFITSLGFSLLLYTAALAAPEPFISKGAVAALTLYLMWTYGATEVLSVAAAVVKLYEEAQASRTLAELEEAAEHFGVRIGGVALRVGIVVALAGVAGKAPAVPKVLGEGGLWTRLGTPQGALMRSVMWEGVPVAQATVSGTAVVVREAAVAESSLTNGTLLLIGAVLDTEIAAATSASKAMRTTGGCREDNSRGDAPEHHIATNKNNTAEVRGGPWTPKFEELFQQVGMGLDHPANRLFVVGHKGPHPREYHREVFRRLGDVFAQCATAQECKTKLIEALDKIANEICEPGSELNRLITKNHESHEEILRTCGLMSMCRDGGPSRAP